MFAVVWSVLTGSDDAKLAKDIKFKKTPNKPPKNRLDMIILTTLDKLLVELSELELSIDISTKTQPIHPINILRTGLNNTTDVASREASRFALVARLSADTANAGFGDSETTISVCGSLANSIAMVVANVQALDAITIKSVSSTRSSRACPGQMLMKDVRNAVRNIIKSFSGMVKLVRDQVEVRLYPLQEKVLTTEDANQVVAHCGRALRMCEVVRQIPTTPFAAVKRSLLKTARLVKTSYQEIKEEHLQDISLDDKVDTTLKASIINGLGVLRASMNLLKFSIVSSESFYITECAADVSNDIVVESSEFVGDLDNVAIASEALGDAVIDFADAINTGGEEAPVLGLDEEDELEEIEDKDNIEEGSNKSMTTEEKNASINLIKETSEAYLEACKSLSSTLQFTRLGLTDLDEAMNEIKEATTRLINSLC